MRYLFLIASLFYIAHVQSQDCKRITTVVDKFTGDTTYSTPVIKIVSAVKIKSSDTSRPGGRTYLSLRSYGYNAVLDAKGAYVILEDGTKLSWPEQTIDVRVNKLNNTSFEYSAFIELTEEQSKLLSEKAITDFRIYVFDMAVNSDYAKKFVSMMKCLITK